MTPFGVKMRELRTARGLTQQQQADYLGVSKAYISSLEHGARGQPTGPFVDQICAWLGLIWDDAEELKMLATLSHPKPTIDARQASPVAIRLANFLAQNIDRFDDDDCQDLLDLAAARLKNGK